MKINKKIVFATSALAFAALTTPVFASGYDYYTSSYYTPNDLGAFYGMSALVWCCICLIPLVIDIVLAFIVYRDGKKNKVDNYMLWALLSFFFSLIGFLVYYVAIRPDAMKKAAGDSAPKPEDK